MPTRAGTHDTNTVHSYDLVHRKSTAPQTCEANVCRTQWKIHTTEYDFTTPPEKMEYTTLCHTQRVGSDDVSAFSAFGHGIIDTEVMMGM